MILVNASRVPAAVLPLSVDARRVVDVPGVVGGGRRRHEGGEQHKEHGGRPTRGGHGDVAAADQGGGAHAAAREEDRRWPRALEWRVKWTLCLGKAMEGLRVPRARQDAGTRNPFIPFPRHKVE